MPMHPDGLLPLIYVFFLQNKTFNLYPIISAVTPGNCLILHNNDLFNLIRVIKEERGIKE